MPRADGTGTMGMGPMTGRAAGYCAGFRVSGYANPFPWRDLAMGFRRGRGFGGGGRGWRHWFYATGLPGWIRFGGRTPAYGYLAPYGNLNPEVEKQALKNQADVLQSELDAIKKRLSELETSSTAE